MKYWLFAPGNNAEKWEEFYEQGIMAIGWDELGDLQLLPTKAEITTALHLHYPKEGSRKNDATANFEFANEMEVGDIVIVKKGTSILLGFGTVKSDYFFDPDRPDFKHCRQMDWNKKGHWSLEYTMVLKTLTDITTVKHKEDDALYLYQFLLDGMNKSSRNTKDLIIPFSEWLQNTIPDSYRQYLGVTVSHTEERLREIAKFFPEGNIFEIEEDNPDTIIEYLKVQLSKSERSKNPNFDEYDKKHSNGIPKAIIGKNHYIRFLKEYFSSSFSYWLFQGSPKIYDINKALRDGHLKSWKVTAHKDKIKRGDKVILWQTGEKAGCYALAKVVSEVGEFSEDPMELQHYVREEYRVDHSKEDRVKIEITHNLADDPILWENIKTFPQFDSFKAGNQGTNFSVTKEEFKTLLQMAENKNERVEVEDINALETIHPLNLILFGAPGTGKTYHTKKVAVDIINGVKDRTRAEIVRAYKELSDKKQIVFTTFHQSLSYEDFIEGIKPETIDGNVVYEVKDGIFKQLVKQAQEIPSVLRTEIDWDNVDFYKMSLGGRQNPLEHQYCITNNVGGISWGGNNDLTELSKIQDLKTYRDTFIQKFPDVAEKNRYNIQVSFALNKMKEGDIVIATKGNSKIDAIGKVTGGYFYDENNMTSLIHFRNIEWLLTDLNTTPTRFFEKQISQMSIYQFDKKDVNIEAFKELTSTSGKTLPKNHVLVIDEINRGNVSAIFGELITLLEEDKRKGNREETEVILPYSGEKFSVPKNLYIIATMNTADRSVEALDTALRRRFSFLEMQPDPEVLEDSAYSDVDLKQLLKTINARIEVLIDKDHQIGHSYFIGIKTLEDLKRVFKDKIIPLLEEYFYGDSGKIGLILGSEFIVPEESSAKFPKNFSYDNDLITDKKIYRLKPFDAWNEASFISIYQES